MKILVTGGAGYVGSELVRLLMPTHKVTVFDNFMCGAETLIGMDRVNIISGDIRDAETLRRAIADHDIIIHLASIVGYSACEIDPDFVFQVNVEGTRNVVKALYPSQLLIYCSTSSSYGHREGDVDETTELNPLTTYGVTKAKAETIVHEHINSIIFRPATAFGVSKKIRLDLLVNTFIYLALARGQIDVYEPEAIRPIIHVKDFAAALKWAAEGNIPIGETYNLVCNNFTKQEIAEEICRLAGTTFNIIDGEDPDQRSYKLNSDKLLRVWSRCNYSIEYAYSQLSRLLPVFSGNYNKYSTLYYIKRFLGKEQHEL